MEPNPATNALSCAERELIIRAQPRLRRLAAALACPGSPDADDLYQLGLEVAVRRVPRFNLERGMTFYSYIYPDVRAAMLEACKREQRAQAIREDALAAGGVSGRAVETPEEVYLDAEERARVRGVLATLDDVDRKLVEICTMGGEPIAEAARCVGLDYDRARYRWQVARSTLFRRLRSV